MAKMSDFEYQTKRNKLIPQAVKAADIFTADLKEHVDSDFYAKQWNKAYLTTMDKLAKEAKLIS